MLEITKWAKGKSFMFALLAPQIAITARDIHEAFQYTKQRRVMKHQFPLPNLPAWHAMYRSHRKPLTFLRKIFADFSKFGSESIEFGEATLEGARQLGRSKQSEIPLPSPDQINQIEFLMENMLVESLQEIKDDISPNLPDPSLKAELLSLLEENSLESSFFMLVTVPCWLIYRTSPTILYRKARQGDFSALEKLLNLDPLMLHDPTIGKRIQELRFNNKTSKYEQLLEGHLKDHHLNVTSQQMKYAMGGLLSALATILKQKLSAPDIQKLFNAIAKDFDGHLSDHDLPVGDSFARAIYRYRHEWLKVFQPDTRK
jgi:hypothetical protein